MEKCWGRQSEREKNVLLADPKIKRIPEFKKVKQQKEYANWQSDKNKRKPFFLTTVVFVHSHLFCLPYSSCDLEINLSPPFRNNKMYLEDRGERRLQRCILYEYVAHLIV